MTKLKPKPKPRPKPLFDLLKSLIVQISNEAGMTVDEVEWLHQLLKKELFKKMDSASEFEIARNKFSVGNG